MSSQRRSENSSSSVSGVDADSGGRASSDGVSSDFRCLVLAMMGIRSSSRNLQSSSSNSGGSKDNPSDGALLNAGGSDAVGLGAE